MYHSSRLSRRMLFRPCHKTSLKLRLPSAPVETEDEVLVIDGEPETLEEPLAHEDVGDELGNDDSSLKTGR